MTRTSLLRLLLDHMHVTYQEVCRDRQYRKPSKGQYIIHHLEHLSQCYKGFHRENLQDSCLLNMLYGSQTVVHRARYYHLDRNTIIDGKLIHQ